MSVKLSAPAVFAWGSLGQTEIQRACININKHNASTFTLIDLLCLCFISHHSHSCLNLEFCKQVIALFLRMSSFMSQVSSTLFKKLYNITRCRIISNFNFLLFSGSLELYSIYFNLWPQILVVDFRDIN